MKTESVNELAVRAAWDESAREELIRQQEQNILRMASRASYRYVTKSDDEWSIALVAFSDAIDRYSPEKGDFLAFARLVISHALTDYHRGRSGGLQEVPVSPFVLEGNADPEEEEDTGGVYLAVVEQSREASDRSMQDEVIAANEMLAEYGFRFYDLTECSPRQEKTRMQCAAAVRALLGRPELMKELKRTRKLPIRAVENASGIPRKILDRYRKYIITATLLLEGDYPQLAEYLKFVREEGKT